MPTKHGQVRRLVVIWWSERSPPAGKQRGGARTLQVFLAMASADGGETRSGLSRQRGEPLGRDGMIRGHRVLQVDIAWRLWAPLLLRRHFVGGFWWIQDLTEVVKGLDFKKDSWPRTGLVQSEVAEKLPEISSKTCKTEDYVGVFFIFSGWVWLLGILWGGRGRALVGVFLIGF